jgi:protein-S-isoprenylcysteine O-methyltransferase Ste14
MDNKEMTTEALKNELYKDKVHSILAHSYALYFILFLVGVFLDLTFPLEFLKHPIFTWTGIFLIILATLITFWAQNTSRNLKKETLTKETFSQGPYRFSRSPTHWALFLLMIGFGITINALFVVFTSILSFILAKAIFLQKEENILAQKYGDPYLAYKKAVRL